ncbi:MAG: hypothetical protein J6Z30_06885, partial [Pyramidobacter sp.]|nr:hypothetical protein [Pyramidobacter sp.]
VSADLNNGAGANITVKNTWSNPYVDFKMTDGQNKSSTVPFSVVSDIENHGGIVNNAGMVTLATSVGSIRSVSADIIGGMGISIEAPRGSISLTSEGILTIDVAPENVWGEWLRRVAENKDLNDAWQGLNAYGNPYLLDDMHRQGAATDLAMTGDFSKLGHVVSGGNIFITAGVINVNGTIQSGFGTYGLNIASELASKIADYDRAWKKAGSKAIADKVSLLSAYKLTESGITYDQERGEYVSNPASWYNPSTQRIVVDDISGSGGTIYLTGKVINTNVWDNIPDEQFNRQYAHLLAEHRGRIIAYTGPSEVTIESALDTTLRLGRIDAKSNPAKIVINDTAKSGSAGDPFRRTIYTFEDGQLKVDDNGTISTFADGKTAYQPLAGLRYITNAVKKNATTERRTQTQEFDWWDDDWDSNRSTSTKDEKHVDAETTLLPGGTVMTMVDFLNKLFTEKWDSLNDEDKRYFKDLHDHPEKGNDYYTFRFEDLISTTATVKPANWPTNKDWNYNVSYNNWTHYAGKISRTAIISYGKQITITNAIKADNPIAVSIRESAKPGNITINAPKADVLLTDALRSNVSTGEVSITAKNIIATDNALINSNTVNLKAAATIGDEWRGDPVKLIPIDDTVNVKAEAGQAAQTGEDGIEGLINLAVVGGAASVDLKAVDGSATLKADGTIPGRAEGTDIELNSAAGSIGSADVPFAIVGEGDTRLSAFAIDTVNIAKDKGDLRVVWVDTHGDVTLETKDGSIVDAYPVERERNLSDNELVEIWKSAGIISTDADGSSMTAALRDESIANVETLIRSDYAAYLSAVQTLKSVNEQLASSELSEEWKATLTTRKIFLE